MSKTTTTPKKSKLKAKRGPLGIKRSITKRVKWDADKDSFIMEMHAQGKAEATAKNTSASTYKICKHLGNVLGCSGKAVELRLKQLKVKAEFLKMSLDLRDAEKQVLFFENMAKELQAQLLRNNQAQDRERKQRQKLVKVPIFTALFGLYSLK